MITMQLKSGTFTLNDSGDVIRGEGKTFSDPHPSWRILGFLPRFNSQQMVTLEDALNGAPIGHGFVVDSDHGATRVWGSPSNRRAVSVKRT